MTEAVVELRDVFCVHRTDEGDAAALQGTYLDLARAEILCVLGPSGAGKSTLLRVIAGLQTPSAGIVDVLGFDVGRMRPRARARLRHEHVGFLGEHAGSALSPDLQAGQAVALPLALRGVPSRRRGERAAELLDAAGLGDRARARPGELSGGERQRLALCAALAHRPALLLADEPTGELDDAGAETVRRLIAGLARREGASVVVVSHDAASAAIADRVVRLRDGRVVADRRDGDEALVVSRTGWLQLPTEMLTSAGIAGRARVHGDRDGLRLTRAPVKPPPSPRPGLGHGLASAPGTPRGARGASVELQGVSRGYGRRPVLVNLWATFPAGAMTVITGPSGTGKTTLLRLVAGLDRPGAGRVTIDGQVLADYDDEQLACLRRQRIGYLPQEPVPVGFLSANENVALALRLRGWERTAAAARAAVALRQVGLGERAGQRVHRLSAGEAQRVGLARALAGACGLLVVDEPTSRLDEASAGSVAALLAGAAAADGHTVLCATHDPAVIRRADHVLALRRPA
ncbi:MAG: ATP-binding cassette domain-containing protein [Solirubrobacterales bacterium]|nr:ATP-binding cassette domain-containing protein [Solirubrobacterales bacterium]